MNTQSNYNIEDYKLNYRACIPFYILLDRDLSANEIKLYGLIEQLESCTGNVFFNKRTLAHILNVSHESGMIKKMTKKLKEKGYIQKEFREIILNGKKVEKLCWNTVKSGFINDEEEDLNVTKGVAEIPTSRVAEIPTSRVAEVPTSRVAQLPPYNTHNNKTHNNMCVESKDKKNTPTQNEIITKEHQEIFDSKFENRNVKIEDLFEDCLNHYIELKKDITRFRFTKWLNIEEPSNFPLKQSNKKETDAERKQRYAKERIANGFD